MDKQYIEDNDIGIKYLRKQLSVDETEEFEIYLMENPDYLETLELDSTFSHSFGLESERKIDEANINDIHTSVLVSDRKVNPVKWLTSVCGAFFLGFMSNYFTFSFDRTTADLDSAQVQYASIVRGGNDQNISAVFRRSNVSNAPEYVLVLELGAVNGETYLVEIEADENTHLRPIAEYKRLRVSPDGTLALLLPQEDYKTGVYHVTATKPSKEEFRFFIKIQE